MTTISRVFVIQDKTEVNGWNAHPLYKYLKRAQPVSFPADQYPRRVNEVGEIEWNYTKFLIDRQGKVVRRYGPAVDPLAFEGDVRDDSAMFVLSMWDVDRWCSCSEDAHYFHQSV